MNKIIFIFILCILFSNYIVAEELCDSSNVKTEKQLEKAQDCLIAQMEGIKISLKNINGYIEYTTFMTEEILKEKILCGEYKALYHSDPSIVSPGVIDLCNQAREKRLLENAKVLNEMNKMKPKVKKLQGIKTSLELELRIITQMAPLFGIKIPEHK